MRLVEMMCVYCQQEITADDDAQKVSRHEAAHTDCAWAVEDAFWRSWYEAREAEKEQRWWLDCAKNLSPS